MITRSAVSVELARLAQEQSERVIADSLKLLKESGRVDHRESRAEQ